MTSTQPSPSTHQPPQQRMRITYARGEALKYISHLDVTRTWERAFRRANLPVAYSQGFNPRPRFQLAAALPVGVTGRAELLDLWLLELLAPDEVLGRLRKALPPGLDAVDCTEVDLQAASLQSQMTCADYRAVVDSAEPAEYIRRRVQTLLEAATLPRRRQHKGGWQTYDLRPLILSVTVEPAGEGQAALTMHLKASQEGAGRPDDVLDALGLRLNARSVERTAVYFQGQG